MFTNALVDVFTPQISAEIETVLVLWALIAHYASRMCAAIRRGEARAMWLSPWPAELPPKEVQTSHTSAVLLFHAPVERLLKYASSRTHAWPLQLMHEYIV